MRQCHVAVVGIVRVGELEWDEVKARTNLAKHGVSFQEAMTVFLDELAVPFADAARADGLMLIGR